MSTSSALTPCLVSIGGMIVVLRNRYGSSTFSACTNGRKLTHYQNQVNIHYLFQTTTSVKAKLTNLLPCVNDYTVSLYALDKLYYYSYLPSSAAIFYTYPEGNMLDCLCWVNYPREGVVHLEIARLP